MNSHTIVLASGNQKKIQELTDLLSPLNINIIPQKTLGIDDAIEDGLTFVENALIKARHACKHSQRPSLSDDSGIEVDALNGQPGIYSARFSGEQATDGKNNAKLLSLLEGIPDEQRRARYQCVIVYLKHEKDPTPIICQASWEGSILTEPKGNGGFGYDPLFYCPEFHCSAAELSVEQKQRISHRAKALHQLKERLKQSI